MNIKKKVHQFQMYFIGEPKTIQTQWSRDYSSNFDLRRFFSEKKMRLTTT